MTIKQRLLLGTTLPTAMLIVIGLIGLVTQRQLIHMRQVEEAAEGVVVAMFDLNLLTYEFLQYRSDRASQQWRSKHADIGRLLDEMPTDDSQVQTIVAETRQQHDELAALFAELEGAGGSSREAFAARLAGQLNARTYAAVSQATRLAGASRELAKQLDRRAAISLGTSVAVTIVLIVIGSVLFVRAVMKPIGLLRAGAQIIGRGELSHRIDYHVADEAGELARAFDDMAEKLQSMTQSLEQRVAERTKAAEDRAASLTRANEQLDRFNRLAVGREQRMAELKLQINDMARQLGQDPPYDADLAARLKSTDAATDE